MAKYQILYWKKIPSQVKTFDEKNNEFSYPLPNRFQEVIDEIAMRDGNLDSNSYLEGWRWGEIQERDGGLEEVAEQIASEIDLKYPQGMHELLHFFRNSLDNLT